MYTYGRVYDIGGYADSRVSYSGLQSTFVLMCLKGSRSETELLGSQQPTWETQMELLDPASDGPECCACLESEPLDEILSLPISLCLCLSHCAFFPLKNVFNFDRKGRFTKKRSGYNSQS